jgi:hypothetical protein
MAHAIEPTFPQELLNAPKQSRIDYFAKKSIGHDAIVSSCDLAKDNIDFGTAGQIIPIVGPHGVGTTKLAYNLWNHYQRLGLEEAGPTDAQNARYSIGVHASVNAGKINRDYWKRLLTAILKNGGDILIDSKLYVPASEFMLTHPIPWADPKRSDIEMLQRCVVSMLKMRKTKVLFINQAHRLFPEGDVGGCNLSQQMLTDLAAQTQARIVLVGDYGLVREPAGGLDWFHRQLVVHFRRYDKRDSDELGTFVSTVETLLGSMVLPDGQRMGKLTLNDAEQIYNRSVGCIGECKRSFEMAYQHALRTGEKMTTELILPFMTSVKSAKKIALDALAGEQILSDEDDASLSKLLEYGTVTGANASTGRANEARSTKGALSRPKRRIGERNPTRDPVGAVYAQRA